MAITLRAKNSNLTAGAKYSYLQNNYSSGEANIAITNSTGLTADQFLLIGEWGSETSEIVQIDSVASDTHTLTLKAATLFAHSESTKVTVIAYNQVKFYQTAAAAFSDSENYLGVENIQPDSLYTIYQDSANSTGFGWFKFYNETNLKISAASNSIPYTGFAANTAQKIIEGFLRSLNQKDSKLISFNDAFRWLSEAYSIAQTELNLVNREYKAVISSSQSTTSGTQEYAFPTNASEILAVWDETNNLKINECPLEDVDRYNSGLVSSQTMFYIRGNYIGFVPEPTSVVEYKISYIEKTITLSSLTDTIDLPDNKFYILEDFLRFRSSEPLGKPNGQMYYDLFMKSIEDMKTAAISRSSGLKNFTIDRYANI